MPTLPEGFVWLLLMQYNALGYSGDVRPQGPGSMQFKSAFTSEDKCSRAKARLAAILKRKPPVIEPTGLICEKAKLD